MKVIEVVAAVIKKDDKIFITRRGYGEFVDMWEFPGGKLNKVKQGNKLFIEKLKKNLNLK